MLCNSCGKSVGNVSRLCDDCAAAVAGQPQIPVDARSRYIANFSHGTVSTQSTWSRPSVQFAAILFVSLCLFAYNILTVGDRISPVSLGLLFLGNTFALIGALSFVILWLGMVIDAPWTGLLFFIAPGALRRYVWSNWITVKVTATVGIIFTVLAVFTSVWGLTYVPSRDLELFLERSYVAYCLGYAGSSEQEQ